MYKDVEGFFVIYLISLKYVIHFPICLALKVLLLFDILKFKIMNSFIKKILSVVFSIINTFLFIKYYTTCKKTKSFLLCRLITIESNE